MISIRTQRLAGLVMMICVALVSAPHAQAKATCTPAPPTVLSVPRITVPANPVVGQALGNPDGYLVEVAHGLRCTYPPNLIVRYWSSTRIAREIPWTGRNFFHSGVVMPIHLTGVQGVGFAFMAQDRDVGPMQTVTTGVTVLRGPIHPGLPTWGLRGRLFFVVTGPIQGGTIAPQTFAGLYLYTSETHHAFNFGSVEVGPPSKPTCTVSTPSVAIPLGAVESRAFKGIGSVAGNATRTITLQCAGGGGADSDVLLTLTDQTQPANRSDQLTLTANSTAKGVALQLLFGNRLISYGPDAAAIGTPNQWLAGSTGNGTFQIPLTARYIQTGATVRPGTANGLATFTLAYR